MYSHFCCDAIAIAMPSPRGEDWTLHVHWTVSSYSTAWNQDTSTYDQRSMKIMKTCGRRSIKILQHVISVLWRSWKHVVNVVSGTWSGGRYYPPTPPHPTQLKRVLQVISSLHISAHTRTCSQHSIRDLVVRTLLPHPTAYIHEIDHNCENLAKTHRPPSTASATTQLKIAALSMWSTSNSQVLPKTQTSWLSLIKWLSHDIPMKYEVIIIDISC